MASITTLDRKFSFNKNGKTIDLSEPNPNFSPDEVMSFYANTYPELTTASVSGPEIKDDACVFEFVTTIGTKG
jgi:PRTRC genetic system protein C